MQLTDVATVIGENLREARTARGWTLDELAARAGLGRRSLVQIEQGQTNPTVASLLALSDALGIGLPRLVTATNQPNLRVVRAGCVPTLWQGSGGGRAELLVGTAPPHVVELWDWRLGPEDRYTSGPHSAGTQELLQVQQGAMRLEIGDDAELLRAGDTAAFAGTRPHAYAWSEPDDGPRAEDNTARFILAVFQPNVGHEHPGA